LEPSPQAQPTATSQYIQAGTRTFWRVNVALVTAAFCAFAILYCVQPLLPILASVFNVTPAQSSLSLSVTTGVLAIGMLASGIASEMLRRKPLMATSLFVSALLTICTALAPTWHLLLLTRVLTGLTISGLPAVAMAYVSEEIDPASGGLAMGLYVGGTAFGGMTGRLISGIITDLLSWRWAIGIIGGLAMCGSILFLVLLPPSRQFTPHSPNFEQLKSSLFSHFQSRGLPMLFSMGFLLMGSFISIYNYLGFRLMAAPYYFSQTAVGLLFTVYSVGMFSSAWAGHLAARRGRRAVLFAMVILMAAGVLITMAHAIWAVLTGLAVMTFGFFAAHAVVSAWIGVSAQSAKAVASSFYLFCYYAGSSVIGTSAGVFWSARGWPGVTAIVGALLALALAVIFALPTLPTAQNTAPFSETPAV
jgi:YNFM family putative membrane transporter